MALSISSTSQLSIPKTPFSQPHKTIPLSLSSICISNLKPFSSNPQKLLQPIVCAAAKQQSGSSVKSSKKRKKKGPSPPPVSEELSLDDFDVLDEEEGENGGNSKRSDVYIPLPLPKPPAGFVIDDQGRVLMVAPRRIATIVDPTNNLPLECMIRRVFTNSKGDDCLLLCPVDTPVQILKSTNIDGWSAVNDDEVEAILPNAAYALAKIHMHLVHSGSFGITHVFYVCKIGFAIQLVEDFATQKKAYLTSGQIASPFGAYELGLLCTLDISGYICTCVVSLRQSNCKLKKQCYKAGFLKSVLIPILVNVQNMVSLHVNCKSDNARSFSMDDGQDVEGVPNEGVEITCFHLDGTHYMIYTPSEPLLFVAVKDDNGQLRIADDDILDDPAVVSAIDEETEFNALVEEEAALLETMFGER
uniref:Uncharacterized protein n=1 Tax=Chenopodium quinoa TaxID=63459 RepID=A0A803L4U1_CHEQI